MGRATLSLQAVRRVDVDRRKVCIHVDTNAHRQSADADGVGVSLRACRKRRAMTCQAGSAGDRAFLCRRRTVT